MTISKRVLELAGITIRPLFAPKALDEEASFKKKPIPVTAVKCDKEQTIETEEGPVTASVGSWIVTGPKGEQWPIQDDIFRDTYEPLNDEAKEALSEAYLGKAVDNIRVVLALDKTKHAGERQSRHGGQDFISDEEIISTAKKGIPSLSQALLFDKIDVGDDVVIQSKDGLNVVGNIQREGNDLKLVVITVMRKKNFRPKPGTLPIRV